MHACLSGLNGVLERRRDTVLLDVNSNTPGAPPVASAVDCCLACRWQPAGTPHPSPSFAEPGEMKAVKHAEQHALTHDDLKRYA